MPSLDVSCDSRSLFSGVWQPKGWLAVLIGALPVRLKSVFLEVSFPTDKISSFQSVLLKVFNSMEYTVERLLY